MTTRWRIRLPGILLISALTLLVAASCSGKKERTRDRDLGEIKELLAKVEKMAVRRDLEAFDKVTTPSFDAVAFLDAAWCGQKSGTVSFRAMRFRVSDEAARVILEITHTAEDSAKTRAFFGLDAVYRIDRWKFSAFDTDAMRRE